MIDELMPVLPVSDVEKAALAEYKPKSDAAVTATVEKLEREAAEIRRIRAGLNCETF